MPDPEREALVLALHAANSDYGRALDDEDVARGRAFDALARADAAEAALAAYDRDHGGQDE